MLASLLLAFAVTEASPPASVALDIPAPPLVTGSWINSRPTTLAREVGNVVVLSFWAAWLPESRDDVRFFNQLHAAYHDRGVKIVALSSESHATIRRFQENYAAHYPLAVDRGGRTRRTYDIRQLPTAVVIDTQGVIAWQGFTSWRSDLWQVVDQLARETAVAVIPQGLDRQLRRVAERVRAGELGYAYEKAHLLEDHRDPQVRLQAGEILDGLDGLIGRTLESANEHAVRGDHAEAVRLLRRWTRPFRGSDYSRILEALAQDLRRNSAARSELRAEALYQRALAAAASPLTNRWHAGLRRVSREHRDTWVNERAQRLRRQAWE